MFIDSHAHLTSQELYPHIADLYLRGKEAGVEAVINICTDPASLSKGIEAQQTYPEIFLAASGAPHDSEEEERVFFPQVAKAALAKKLIAIGETGLDYHYEHASKKVQIDRMLSYFSLAIETSLPIIFHCREAFADLIAIAKASYHQKKALIHCFTGTLEEARQVLDCGWYISISGIVTFAKSVALQEVVRYIPLERLLIETDAPYLAPRSKRGKVNEPSFIVETAQMIADLKKISLAEVACATKNNALQFFAIDI